MFGPRTRHFSLAGGGVTRPATDPYFTSQSESGVSGRVGSGRVRRSSESHWSGRVGSGGYRISRVGSGQEVSNSHWLGRVGSGRVRRLPKPRGSTDPIRPDLTREVWPNPRNGPGKTASIATRRVRYLIYGRRNGFENSLIVNQAVLLTV